MTGAEKNVLLLVAGAGAVLYVAHRMGKAPTVAPPAESLVFTPSDTSTGQGPVEFADRDRLATHDAPYMTNY